MEPQLQQSQISPQPPAVATNFNLDEDRRSYNTSPLPLDESKMPKKWIPRTYDRWVGPGTRTM